jgi:hypothetical protein
MSSFLERAAVSRRQLLLLVISSLLLLLVTSAAQLPDIYHLSIQKMQFIRQILSMVKIYQ